MCAATGGSRDRTCGTAAAPRLVGTAARVAHSIAFAVFVPGVADPVTVIVAAVIRLPRPRGQHHADRCLPQAGRPNDERRVGSCRGGPQLREVEAARPKSPMRTRITCPVRRASRRRHDVTGALWSASSPKAEPRFRPMKKTRRRRIRGARPDSKQRLLPQDGSPPGRRPPSTAGRSNLFLRGSPGLWIPERGGPRKPRGAHTHGAPKRAGTGGRSCPLLGGSPRGGGGALLLRRRPSLQLVRPGPRVSWPSAAGPTPLPVSSDNSLHTASRQEAERGREARPAAGRAVTILETRSGDVLRPRLAAADPGDRRARRSRTTTSCSRRPTATASPPSRRRRTSRAAPGS